MNWKEKVGETLVQLQKTEFLMLGICSHFKDEIKNNYKLGKKKPFGKLNPESFLSELEVDKKKRKHTLGMIIGFISTQNDLFSEERLSEFLNDRNLFVHSLWREYISVKNNNSQKEKDFETFVSDLHKEALYWEGVFKGFLYLMAKSVAKDTGKDISDYESIVELSEFESTFKGSVKEPQ